MSRLLCLNQFVPPDKAPTAVLLGELRDGLTPHGWEVECIGRGSSYRAGKPKGLRRWISELSCHLSLMCRALVTKRPDVVLCLTDPPGLPFTAALIAKLRGAKLVHWAMDVYPEVAAALGEVRRESIIFRAVSKAVKTGYQRCALVVCLDEDMAELMDLAHDPRLMICPPWPPATLTLPADVLKPDSTSIRWVYSGNLGRAHDFETLLRAQQLLEKARAPFDLVFQGGGAMFSEAKRRALELGLQHCQWEGYAPDETFVSSLLSAHALVATQRIETRGMLWPSKLALLKQLPRPIVWVGAEEGSIAKELKADGDRHGVFAPGQHEALAHWLMERQDVLRQVPECSDIAEVAAKLHRLREDAVNKWRTRLAQLV